MVLGSLIIAFALPARKQTQNKAPTMRGFGFSLDVVNVWTLTKINPFISWHYTIFSTLRRRVFLYVRGGWPSAPSVPHLSAQRSRRHGGTGPDLRLIPSKGHSAPMTRFTLL